MAVFRFAGDIGEDHRLEIPRNIPAGPAQIVIIPQGGDPSQGERFRQLVRQAAHGPYHTRTKLDIDTELRREREGWE
jgi:hypothetical protein